MLSSRARSNATEPYELSPGARAALEEINRRLRILEREGWRTSGPWPQDRPILIVEAGSEGVFRARFDAAGSCWAEDGGDIWPVRSPLAWRDLPPDSVAEHLAQPIQAGLARSLGPLK
jgi:hypothetical protein